MSLFSLHPARWRRVETDSRGNTLLFSMASFTINVVAIPCYEVRLKKKNEKSILFYNTPISCSVNIRYGGNYWSSGLGEEL